MHNPTLRVVQVINLLCGRTLPMRLSDISKELNVPKSTLLPILQTLLLYKYIGKDESDRYYPGVALMGAGAAAKAAYAPGEEIRQCLKEMVDRFGETCYFGILEDSMVRYVEKIDSPQPLRMLTSTGHKLPAYATGLGKALLMDHTYEQLKLLYPDTLQTLTEHTVNNLETLERQLESAREQGYTWEVEESTEHIRCFGVPVRKDGVIIGAISIAIPVFRYIPEQKEEMIVKMKTTADRLSNILTLC